MARQWNGAYCQSLSAVARARYESKVLQAGLGIVSYSIDYLTPAVLYFIRYWQMVQERTLHTLAGGRKELYMSDRFKHPTTQQVLLDRRAILSLRFAPNVLIKSLRHMTSRDPCNPSIWGEGGGGGKYRFRVLGYKLPYFQYYF